MIRIHQKQKATNSSDEETNTATKTTNSSRIKNRADACESEEKPKHSSAASSALRILQSGANSRLMLREKLRRKGYSKQEIEEAIHEMQDAGFLDDKRLLFAHAEFLALRKFYGKRRVYLELARKFDRETVDAYFEEALAEVDFSSYCLAFAQKNAVMERDALAAKLSRHGYATSEIRYALSSLKDNNDT